MDDKDIVNVNNVDDRDKDGNAQTAGVLRGFIRRVKEWLPKSELGGAHTPAGGGGVHVPTGGVHTPTGGVHVPTSGVHAPAGGVHVPTGGVHVPTGGVHVPTGSVHVPTGGVHVPTGGVHVPTGGVHVPTGGVHVPTGGVHVPTGGVHVPTGGVHVPTGGVHVPTGGVHVPTGGVHVPGGATHVPTGGMHLPSKVPAQAVGSVTDRLSTAVDAYGYIEKAVKENEPKQSRLQKIIHVIKTAGPVVARSIVLGTILFTVYDDGVVKCGLEFIKNTPHPSKSDVEYKWTAWPRVLLYSGAIGMGAGCLNGLLYSIWNKVIAPRSPMYPVGTMVSHSIVHCGLFSSYEILKRIIMRSTKIDYGDYSGAFAVAIIGALAGAFQEYVNYYTSPLEEAGFNREAIRACRTMPRPAMRGFFTMGILIPNAVGFLAYEYTKDVVLARVEEESVLSTEE